MLFESAQTAFGTADFPGTNPRCNIDIWATNGRIWWRENGWWGYEVNGDQFRERTVWKEAIMALQIGFTRAIGDWIRDENKPHKCQFEVAKLGYEIIMAAYYSALVRRRVEGFRPATDSEWEELRGNLL